MKFAVTNFRMVPKDRLELRVALLQEGRTLQEFFTSVVEEKLTSVRLRGLGTVMAAVEADQESGVLADEE